MVLWWVLKVPSRRCRLFIAGLSADAALAETNPKIEPVTSPGPAAFRLQHGPRWRERRVAPAERLPVAEILISLFISNHGGLKSHPGRRARRRWPPQRDSQTEQSQMCSRVGTPNLGWNASQYCRNICLRRLDIGNHRSFGRDYRCWVALYQRIV